MTKTLRLIVPQWQGGESDAYPLGARLLAWLAPASEAETIEVPVADVTAMPLPLEEGVAGRAALLAQTREITAVLAERQPERLVIFGGDCLVDQAPFAYLNARHQGRLGVLWLDAHPDVATPQDRSRAHTMVLGNLLGRGDPAFAQEVPVKLAPERVLMAGLSRLLPYEERELAALGVACTETGEVATSSAPILDWITARGIRHLAIHLDLDVLDPQLFRAQGFAIPGQPLLGDQKDRVGTMTFDQLARILRDVSAVCDVVGLGITEHKPWDAIHLKSLMAGIPILTG